MRINVINPKLHNYSSGSHAVVKIRQFNFELTNIFSIRNEIIEYVLNIQNKMVEFLITSVDFRQCLRYGVIFFYGSVQHDLETCQRPRFYSNFDPMDVSQARKLKMNDLKRPKHIMIYISESDEMRRSLNYSASFLIFTTNRNREIS